MKHNTHHKYLIFTYLLGMVVFCVFRIANILVYGFSADGWPDFGRQLWHAMAIGLWFDTTVSCYLLALPTLLLLISYLFDIRSRILLRSISFFVLLGYLTAFLACTADIPFFNYFFTRLNAVAINEVSSIGIITNMVFAEPRHWWLLAGYVAVGCGYGFVQKRIYANTLGHLSKTRKPKGRPNHTTPIILKIICSIIWISVIFIGMRGGLGKRPIRVYSAYFCADPFLNQLGLNPTFTLMKSFSEIKKSQSQLLQLTDEATAQQILAQERHTPTDSTLAANAIQLPENMNVVLVIMESMTAEKMGELTPWLNYLSMHSLCFTNAYSAGIHTYNGIYSTLYSTPGVPAVHAMHKTFIPRMHGLPWVLHEHGYQNTFFVPHNENYDNISPFLHANGFDQVVGQSAYNPQLVVGTWGVPDHVLFDYALAHCNKAAKSSPFFTTIMTCSDHMPYVIPQDADFTPKSKKIETQIVEYADWSIGYFLNNAKRQTWFDNTLFVFVADHGANWGTNIYDMALAYHHTPMIFLCPKYIQPQKIDRLALQIDLGPTLLGMLPLTWDNQTFGLDLMRQKREMAYFCSDDKVGVLDNEYYYIYRLQEKDGSLYHYADSSTNDQKSQQSERAEKMKNYALGLLQSAYLTTK